MLTAVVIFLSKYFSKAKEKIKRENIAINNDGIKVKSPKDIIYFLFATEPLTFILFLIEFLIKYINYDINFNSYYTNLVLDQAYEKISYKKGLVKEGDLIVSKNQFIDSETNQKLYSYKRELSNYINNKDFISLFLGNFLISEI